MSDGNLMIMGGQEITIKGSNFPKNIETNTIVINFKDEKLTECVPQSTSSAEIICLTQPFKETSAG